MSNELMDDLETCLTDLYACGDWTKDHDAILARFRAAKGEAGMSGWSWWAKEAGEESYANEVETKEQAIAWARCEYGTQATIEVIEARLWDDDIEGDENCAFAAWRNHEKLVGVAGENGDD